ncbi:glycoside hydrolase family 28 protein [Herbaspirillum sp. DW155]|uniref:glycoside hydrolase family 28 protein n=1 Tax=Herbaspirillum sp. DW155 TaxID=3095609 RepID=UPI003086CEAC|nr:glycoside hydrolase family 28 protein [Herbaspirillum sp. DW155]
MSVPSHPIASLDLMISTMPTRFPALNPTLQLIVAALLLVLMMTACVTAHAQDRRMVSEPSLPPQSAVCITLLPVPASSSAQDTRRLQQAIDACGAGQAVRLMAGIAGGRFVSGPLVMKSGVTLWLDEGVTLVAAADPALFDRNGRCGTIDEKGAGCRPFLLFEGTRGGGIVGTGRIDGQGGEIMAGSTQSWWQLARRAQQEHGKQNVPRLIQVVHAHDITFYRITLTNAPNFHLSLSQTEGATLWGIRIDTPADARNTDGIDPADSQDVTIAHSFIRTGDDHIAIKAGHGGTRYVSIVDDHLYWGHGLSIGSEIAGGVSDILVRDVSIDGAVSGLRIKSDASRGGLVSAVRYENVCLRNNRHPLEFDTRYDAHAKGDAIPVYRDILLRHVSGEGGSLVVRGHDADHPLALMLDGVAFAGGAIWQVDYAHLGAGPGGVSPLPAGLTAPPAGVEQMQCAARWVPFPSG